MARGRQGRHGGPLLGHSLEKERKTEREKERKKEKERKRERKKKERKEKEERKTGSIGLRALNYLSLFGFTSSMAAVPGN